MCAPAPPKPIHPPINTPPLSSPRPDKRSLGAVTALFLALAAIQFVVQDGVPASSYVTSQQALILLSYVCLIAVGLENVAIWWLTIYHKDKQRWAGALVIELDGVIGG